MTSSSGPSHSIVWMSPKSGDISRNIAKRSRARACLRSSASGPSPGNGSGYEVSHDSVDVTLGRRGQQPVQQRGPGARQPADLGGDGHLLVEDLRVAPPAAARSRSRSASSADRRRRVSSTPSGESRASSSSAADQDGGAARRTTRRRSRTGPSSRARPRWWSSARSGRDHGLRDPGPGSAGSGAPWASSQRSSAVPLVCPAVLIPVAPLPDPSAATHDRQPSVGPAWRCACSP